MKVYQLRFKTFDKSVYWAQSLDPTRGLLPQYCGICHAKYYTLGVKAAPWKIIIRKGKTRRKHEFIWSDYAYPLMTKEAIVKLQEKSSGVQSFDVVYGFDCLDPATVDKAFADVVEPYFIEEVPLDFIHASQYLFQQFCHADCPAGVYDWDMVRKIPVARLPQNDFFSVQSFGNALWVTENGKTILEALDFKNYTLHDMELTLCAAETES